MKLDDTLIDIFGADSLDYDRYQVHSLAEIGSIALGRGPTPRHQIVAGYKSGIRKAITKVQTALDVIDEKISDDDTLVLTATVVQPEAESSAPTSRQVFVVHGHDEQAKSEVARCLDRLGLEAVILHEQADMGRTIIEKFEDHAEAAGYAVVILTPDDHAGVADDGSSLIPRPRQNVILELGYFIGKLGRSRVCALRKGDHMELPSDILGVLYKPMDEGGAWQYQLAGEIKAAGIDVDLNLLAG